MAIYIHAIYEHGVLRPLEALPFREGQEVYLTTTEDPSLPSKASLIERLKLDDLLLDPSEIEGDAAPLSPEEMARLAKLLSQHDSLSQWIIDAREDRL